MSAQSLGDEASDRDLVDDLIAEGIVDDPAGAPAPEIDQTASSRVVLTRSGIEISGIAGLLSGSTGW